MHVLLQDILNALTIAGTFSGVPFVGSGAAILNVMCVSFDNISIYKDRCRQLIRRCTEHQLLLLDSASKLHGTNLQEAADEFEYYLLSTSQKLKKWSSWGRAKSYWKQEEISKGLSDLDNQLMTVTTTFHLRANIQIHAQVSDNGQAANQNHREVMDLLQQVLTSRQEISEVARMAVEERLPVAERLMSDGQQEMDLQPRDSQRYLDYQRGLLNLHQSTGVPPSVPNLSKEITRTGVRAVTGGTFSDVWMGEWLGGKKVALKGLRGVTVSPSAQRRFEREIVVWSKLEHPNILPLFGIVTNMGPHIHLVSPWQENGNALDFVKSHLDVNRLELLAGAARGLEYLHSPGVGVVHGNVKCSNILVSDKGIATICDFGLSILVEEVTEVSASATLTASGSARWLAPELIEGTINSPTPHTDIYGFSMAVLECCTLKRPFAHRKRDAAVIRDVTVDRLHPPRPADSVWLTDDVWAVMCRCWSNEPDIRPPMHDVVMVLENSAHISSRVDEEMMEE